MTPDDLTVTPADMCLATGADGADGAPRTPVHAYGCVFCAFARGRRSSGWARLLTLGGLERVQRVCVDPGRDVPPIPTALTPTADDDT